MLSRLGLRHLPALRARSFASASTIRAVEPASSASGTTEGETHIIQKLTTRFEPSKLNVEDVSGGCGTFYAITIASKAFKGLSIVKQHKLVTEELKAEVAKIHGLQIKTIAE